MRTVKKLEAKVGSWSDQRGWGLNPLLLAGLKPEAVGDLHLVSLQPGAVRGNHYHEHATEWIVLFGGAASVAWRTLATGELQVEAVAAKTPVVFEIPAGVAHAIRNDADEPIYLLSLSTGLDRGTVKVEDLFADKRSSVQ